MSVRFGGAPRSGGMVLKLDGVSCGFGESPLFPEFSAEIQRGERVALIGPNGSGKTTLLRSMAAETNPRTGSVLRGASVRLAYYRQDFSQLRAEATVARELSDACPRLGDQQLREHLAKFLFEGDALDTRIQDLSGGEKARVALAIATLQNANLLLLDEPTNHLDIQSREALEEALTSYDGAIVFVSHDRAFLGALSTRVWALDGQASAIVDYPGSYDEWSVSRAAAARVAPSAGAPESAGSETSRSPRGTLSKNEISRREKQLDELESRIHVLEEALQELEEKLAQPETYTSSEPELARRLHAEALTLRAELSQSYTEWERISEELAGSAATSNS